MKFVLQGFKGPNNIDYDPDKFEALLNVGTSFGTVKCSNKQGLQMGIF